MANSLDVITFRTQAREHLDWLRRQKIDDVPYPRSKALEDNRIARNAAIRMANEMDAETCSKQDMDGLPWSRMADIRCWQCNEVVPKVVVVGEDDDCDSGTARLCESCLRAALAALEAAQ